MTCPNCRVDTESKVIDSRGSRRKIRRRRECLKCGRRFTTAEHVVKDPDFDSVANVVARLEAIQREAIAGLSKARDIQAGIGD